MSFAWPWLLLLLPLYWLVPKSKKAQVSGAIEHPFLASLAQTDYNEKKPTGLAQIISLLIWLLLVIALARPQWIGAPLQDESLGRGLYLSVDLSDSMRERDMSWNGRTIARYQAVQGVVDDFIAQRPQDFIGLVVFGSFAEIQAPLTPDTRSIQKILADLLPGMAGGSTAIGDGLALAAKQLRQSESKDKVIILLSDGENTSGSVTPEEALSVAKQSNIKVYTIGFGRAGFFGSGIDERTLANIAKETGGEFFSASSTSELAQVFEFIDSLEPAEEYLQDQREITELYWWPLLVATLFQILLLALPLWSTLRRQHDSA